MIFVILAALPEPPLSQIRSLVRLAQAVFVVAVLFTFYSAVVPPAKMPVHLVPWDKAEHFIAFYVLTYLGVAAFPRRSTLWLALVLSAFGAAIEIVQGTDYVRRDRDFWDWVADTIAIVAAIAPMWLVSWREAVRRADQK
jgi:hypothetical protein